LNNFLAAGFVLVGCACVGLCVHGFRSGVMRTPRGNFRRKTHPELFWIGAIFNAVMALIFFCAVLFERL
jgi:hypothetical protein